MNVGAAVLTFREGLEAALIVAIMLTYLRKVGRPDAGRFVWIGAGSAVALTIGFVGLLQIIGAEFEYPEKGVFEGVTGVLAVAMVTYMTFWMSRQGRQMKGHLESGVRESLAEGGRWGLFTLVFLAVIREGIETGLFLSAATFASSGTQTLVGGIVGLAIAIVVAVAIYAGGVRLNLGRFFQIAGILLVVFGAAMLRYSVHEFEEVGLIPPMIERIWYTGRELPEGTGVGAVLQALVGYTSKPSLSQLLAFVGYYLVVGLALWRPWRRWTASGTVAQTTVA
ncbi:MAG TPA: FTR1 family protein [Thermomicrobiales bacterium]|nr:FTR1 family protein [Thermomicrobiales bacterium]